MPSLLSKLSESVAQLVESVRGSLPGSWSRTEPRQLLLTAAIASSVLGLLYCVRRNRPRLPPGPTPWPVVGNILSLSERMHEDIMELKEKYGDVFTLYIGTDPMIVLASYDAIKEAFLVRGSDFASRPENPVLSKEMFDDEIFSAPFNEKWSKDKKYAVTSLRTLSGIKAGADGNMVAEMEILMEKLRQLDQKPVDISELAMVTAVNVISGVLFNERFEDDDPKLQRMIQGIREWYQALNAAGWYIPFLPAWAARIVGRKALATLREASQRLEQFVEEQVDEHRKTFDPNHMRDFVDMYLNKPDISVGKSFYDTVLMVLPDSTDTIAVFMRWIVLFVCLHPDVQKKAQAEIDGVVGPGQSVSMVHRGKLPYTEAVLLEVMRISDASVMTGFHSATKPHATIRGYDVPLNASIIGSLHSVHKNPKLFPEPQRFDPERFIDDKGGLVNANLVIPFSVGRRMCLGEGIAKAELLLFLANVLHTFQLSFPPGEPLPSTTPCLGMIMYPEPYKVIFSPRQ